MKKIILRLFSFLSIFCLTAGFAGEEKKGYVELGGGTGLALLTVPSYAGGVVGGRGWNGAFGYNVTPKFSVEAGFIRYITHDSSEDQQINTPYIAGRFAIPLSQRFALLLKIGLMDAVMTTTYKDEFEGGWIEELPSRRQETDAYVLPFTGIGVSYALSPRFDLNVQYQGAVYVIGGLGLLSTGLTYHF